MKQALTAITIIASIVTASANAELFVCRGTGRFGAVTKKPVYLEWTKQIRQIILQNDTEIVSLELDDANQDGTHYASQRSLKSYASAPRTW